MSFLALADVVLLMAGASAQTAPPPPAPSVPSVLAALPIKIYGVLKPSVHVSNPVETYTQINHGAPVAAANPVFVEDADAPVVSFQVGQTRAGVVVGDGLPVRGHIEIDFIHFNLASPTTGAFPRLRIASVEWEPLEGHKLFVGQGWDVFSPVNPFGYNLVGAQFLAGNAGFMRQQAYWTSTLGGLELVGGVGMPAPNNAAYIGNPETGLLPSVVGRISYRHEKKLWIGSSWIAALSRVTAANRPEVRKSTLAGNVFAEIKLGALALKAEAYGGRNTANIGLLTLASGTMDKDLYDVGGYFSMRHALGEKHAVHITAGGAMVLNDEDLAMGYTPATPTAKAARTGNGIDRNAVVRGGYTFTPVKGLDLFVEGTAYSTRHKLAPADAAKLDRNRAAVGVESGAMLKF